MLKRFASVILSIVLLCTVVPCLSIKAMAKKPSIKGDYGSYDNVRTREIPLDHPCVVQNGFSCFGEQKGYLCFFDALTDPKARDNCFACVDIANDGEMELMCVQSDATPDEKNEGPSEPTYFDAQDNDTLNSNPKTRLSKIIQTTSGDDYTTEYTFTYNLWNLPASIRIAGSSGYEHTLEYTYDETGRFIRYGSSDEDVYTYDDNGKLLKHTKRVGDMVLTYTYFYDSEGKLDHCINDFGGFSDVSNYFYDQNGHLERIQHNSETVYYTYDNQGRLQEVQSETSSTIYSYNEKGRLESTYTEYKLPTLVITSQTKYDYESNAPFIVAHSEGTSSELWIEDTEGHIVWSLEETRSSAYTGDLTFETDKNGMILFAKDDVWQWKFIYDEFPEDEKDVSCDLPAQKHWSEDVLPDTVVSFPVPGGSLYFGQYAYEDGTARAKQIHLIGADTSVIEAIIPQTVNGLTVVSIAAKAFDQCTFLQRVEIPSTVTSVAETVFIDCISLTEIVVAEGNSNYWAKDGALFHDYKINDYRVGTFLIRYPAANNSVSFEIPKGVSYLCAYSFSDAGNLRTVTIPESVTSIDYAVFRNCNRLSDIYYSGSSSQWASVSNMCTDTPFLMAQVHCNMRAERKEAIIRQVVLSPFVQFLLSTPHAMDIFTSLISISLVLIPVRIIMHKSIRERKRYVRYRRNTERKLQRADFSSLYFSEEATHTKSISIATMLLLLLAAVVIGILLVTYIISTQIDEEIKTLADLMDLIFVLEYWGFKDKIETLKIIKLFSPLQAFLLLIVILLLVIGAYWAVNKFKMWRKEKKGSSKMTKIPIRVRVINRERSAK